MRAYKYHVPAWTCPFVRKSVKPTITGKYRAFEIDVILHFNDYDAVTLFTAWFGSFLTDSDASLLPCNTENGVCVPKGHAEHPRPCIAFGVAMPVNQLYTYIQLLCVKILIYSCVIMPFIVLYIINLNFIIYRFYKHRPLLRVFILFI